MCKTATVLLRKVSEVTCSLKFEKKSFVGRGCVYTPWLFSTVFVSNNQISISNSRCRNIKSLQIPCNKYGQNISHNITFAKAAIAALSINGILYSIFRHLRMVVQNQFTMIDYFYKCQFLPNLKHNLLATLLLSIPNTSLDSMKIVGHFNHAKAITWYEYRTKSNWPTHYRL